MPDAVLYTPDCGHIAPMCDRDVQDTLWPDIVERLLNIEDMHNLA
jgi:hypothetical protein